MTNGEKLGNKLYELRKKAGLSQEELAEKLNVSRQAVSKWECGESLPDTNNLITISKLYGVSLDELVGNEPTKEEPVQDKSSEEKEVCALPASVQDEDEEDGDDREDDEDEEESIKNRGVMARILYALPSPIVVTIAFLLWGFIWDGWAVAWTLYLLIPVYHSLIDCVRQRRWSAFLYPVFITFIYTFIGMQWDLWHPYWILYITIPIYYAIASAIDRG